jgi:hypothetical protein
MENRRNAGPAGKTNVAKKKLKATVHHFSRHAAGKRDRDILPLVRTSLLPVSKRLCNTHNFRGDD